MSVKTEVTVKDPRSVKGVYKGEGLTDPDEIYMRKHKLLLGPRHGIASGWGLLIFGVLLILPVFLLPGPITFGAFVGGVIMLPFGLIAVWLGRRQRRIVEDGTAQYCSELGIDPV